MENVSANDELVYDLADLFKIFGDTTRMRIMFTLIDSPKTVNEISRLLSVDQSAISHQLKVLKDNCLVTFKREGKSLRYFLADDHVKTIIGQGYNHITEEKQG